MGHLYAHDVEKMVWPFKLISLPEQCVTENMLCWDTFLWIFFSCLSEVEEEGVLNYCPFGVDILPCFTLLTP